MKTHCLALALLACTIHAEQIPAESKITDVTVYADRAQVTRAAEVSLVPGENRIRLAELPASLVDDSVRAAGKASGPVTIQDVEVRTVLREQTADATAKELETRVLRLRDEIAALDGRQRVLDQQRNLLVQIQIKSSVEVSRDIQVNKFDVAQLKDLPALLAGEFAKIEEQSQKIALDRRELQPRLAAAEAEFNKHQAAASRASKTVVVTVNAKEATKLQLQVSYVLGGASWSPTYDARAAADSGKVEFTYNGVVRQQTGEDWRGVNLTLSTARPSVGARMPELGKWTVNFPEYSAANMPALAPAPAKFGREMLMNSTATITPALPEPAQMQEARIEESMTAANFRIPRATDVPSDGEPHRQTITTIPLGATFSYAATPKLSTFAYLRAGVTNTTDAPLLGGPVNVFVGADFMGAGWIGIVPPGAKFDLFLGVDDGVHIKREESKEKRGKSGIINRRTRQVYAYKLIVENFKNAAQTVTIYEPIPVSANDDIKVTLGDVSLKPTEADPSKGKLTWELELKPREKREIAYEFTVDWPQDRQVSGL
jgi:uncharacterized protein (TIGR02231 family)